MKVHITGGKGFLGPYVAGALAPEHEVEITDLDGLDVMDLDAAAAHLAKSKPDVVVHLAGLTGAEGSLRQPYEFFRVNSFGTLNVMEACRRAGVDKVVFMSTLTVHGATEGSSVREEASYEPRHPYAGSKASAELIVKTYSRSYCIRAVILRATLVAGEGQREPNAVTEFVRKALEGGVLEIYGEGDHAREWLHPSDLAAAVRSAVRHLAGGDGGGCETFIVSSGRPLSMRELAERVISVVGKGRVEFQPATRQAFSLCSAPEKAKRVLGWAPKVSMDEIIRRIADHQRRE